MDNTSYQFRPCDCCIPAFFPEPRFDGKVYLYECSDKCGELVSWVPESNIINEDGLCPYTATTTVNVSLNPCLYYRNFERTDNWSNVLSYDVPTESCINPFDGLTSDSWRRYSVNINGNCTVDTEAGGGPGQSRDITISYNTPITNCNYKLIDPNNVGFTNTTATVDASEFISKIGNTKNKSTTTLEKIYHSPTPTCYLKIWVRTRVQRWKIPVTVEDFEGSGIWSPPNYEAFDEDPNCPTADEGPDWEDDPCYKRTIDDDPFCCNISWDSFCQDFYESCLAEFVPPVICDGPFVADGPVSEEDGQEYTYEWRGSGNPCLIDPSKAFDTEENVIEANINWTFEVSADGPSTGKSVLFEMKYSMVEGYEPKWPSERAPSNECKQDRYPLC